MLGKMSKGCVCLGIGISSDSAVGLVDVIGELDEVRHSRRAPSCGLVLDQ
jgi:hypothetical protein